MILMQNRLRLACVFQSKGKIQVLRLLLAPDGMINSRSELCCCCVFCVTDCVLIGLYLSTFVPLMDFKGIGHQHL